jgi:glycerate kinase
MRILIAPDKFKGSLAAAQAAEAIRRGIARARPEAECRMLPLADGGEGTAEVLCAALSGEWLSLPAHDPLGREIEAGYAWLPDRTAVISMSAASGLWRVQAHERDILRASTFGTGELMLDAWRRGARKILVGLGGSATNDGGMGAAAACGFEFLDATGALLEPIPLQLARLTHIRRPISFATAEMDAPEVVGMCDVENPLLGPRGATRTYGPQKGADGQTLVWLEEGLTRLADVVASDLGNDFRAVPGAGAAGGMGFGLMSFWGAQVRSGFTTIAEAIDLETIVAQSDLVVTGEGSMDAQTLEGKGPAGVAVLARKLGKRVIAFAGCMSDEALLRQIFDGVFALKDETISLETAMKDAEFLLESKAAEVAALFI